MNRYLALGIMLMSLGMPAMAGTPLWSFTPLTPTTIQATPLSINYVQYRVTNQSNRTHPLSLVPLVLGRYDTIGPGKCDLAFTLGPKESCVLSILILGRLFERNLIEHPTVCSQSSRTQCYQPAEKDLLTIVYTRSLMIPQIYNSLDPEDARFDKANISIAKGSPIVLNSEPFTANTKTIIIKNNSTHLTANNITAEFVNPELYNKVEIDSSACMSVASGKKCELRFTNNNFDIPAQQMRIKGDNTSELITTIASFSKDAASIVMQGKKSLAIPTNSQAAIVIKNQSNTQIVRNIVPYIKDTRLNKFITVVDNNCQDLQPSASCQIVFLAGARSVGKTKFIIQGDDSRPAVASILISKQKQQV